MSHPRIQAGFSLLVLATAENGGALSVAVLAASVAWQLEHERITNCRPASAFPAAASATGVQANETAVTVMIAYLIMRLLRYSSPSRAALKNAPAA